MSDTKPCTAGIKAPPMIDITIIAPAVSVYFFSTDFNVCGGQNSFLPSKVQVKC